MCAGDLMDLCLHAALTAVGVTYRGEAHCKIPIPTFLIVSSSISGLFALSRLLNTGPTLCGVRTTTLQPLTSWCFATWGWGVTGAQLGFWSFVNENADGFCALAPMAAGAFASVLHAVYLCAALLSLAGVLASILTLWLVAYHIAFPSLFAAYENANNHEKEKSSTDSRGSEDYLGIFSAF
jgi:hypothetical protein